MVSRQEESCFVILSGGDNAGMTDSIKLHENKN